MTTAARYPRLNYTIFRSGMPQYSSNSDDASQLPPRQTQIRRQNTDAPSQAHRCWQGTTHAARAWGSAAGFGAERGFAIPARLCYNVCLVQTMGTMQGSSLLASRLSACSAQAGARQGCPLLQPSAMKNTQSQRAGGRVGSSSRARQPNSYLVNAITRRSACGEHTVYTAS